MKKQKKYQKFGFTLVELIAVVTILGILAILAIPAVNKVIKNSQINVYNTQKSMIIDSAKNWVADNVKSLKENKTIYITLAQLKQAGYVDKALVPNIVNECLLDDSEVEITSEDDKYLYTLNESFGNCNDINDEKMKILLIKGNNSIINNAGEVVTKIEVTQENGKNFNNIDPGYKLVYEGIIYDDINTLNNSVCPNCRINFEVTKNKDKISDNDVSIIKLNSIFDTYQIRYTFSDNVDTAYAVRNIIIEDTTKPIITMNTDADFSFSEGSQITDKFLMSRFSVNDNSNSVSYLFDNFEAYKNFYKEPILLINGGKIKKITEPGTYNIELKITDISGNTAKKTFKITPNIAINPSIAVKFNGINIDSFNSSNNRISTNNQLKINIQKGSCTNIIGASYTINGVETMLNGTGEFIKNIDEGVYNQDQLSAKFTCADTGKTFSVSNKEFIYDYTKPNCNISHKSGTLGNNGWYKTNPTFTMTASDNISGLNSCGFSKTSNVSMSNCSGSTTYTRDLEQSEDTSGKILYGEVIDNNGNSNECNSGTIKVDTVAPSCEIVATGTMSGDWYTSDVSLTLNATDSTSGVDTCGFGTTSNPTQSSCSSVIKTISHTTNTSGITYYATVTDKAGNTNTCQKTIKVDKQTPTCTIAASGTGGNNGWYKSNVTLSLNPSFGPSGGNTCGFGTSNNPSMNSCSSITTLSQSDSAGITYYGKVTDKLGRTATCQKTIKVDTVAPTYTATGSTKTSSNIVGKTLVVSNHPRSSSGGPSSGTSQSWRYRYISVTGGTISSIAPSTDADGYKMNVLLDSSNYKIRWGNGGTAITLTLSASSPISAVNFRACQGTGSTHYYYYNMTLDGVSIRKSTDDYFTVPNQDCTASSHPYTTINVSTATKTTNITACFIDSMSGMANNSDSNAAYCVNSGTLYNSGTYAASAYDNAGNLGTASISY